MALGDLGAGERHWRRAVGVAAGRRAGVRRTWRSARAAFAGFAGWIAASAERDADFGRRFLWLPVAFAAGIALYFALPVEPAPWQPALLALAAGALFVRFTARPVAAAAAAFLAALAAGTAAVTIDTRLVAAPAIEREGSFRITGFVVSKELRGEHRVRYRVRIRSMEGVAPERMPRTVRISAPRSGPTIAVGDAIATAARLGPPRGPVYPGGYDSARRLFFDGIGGTGFSYGAPDRIELPDRPAGIAFAAAVANLRAAIAARIRAALDGPPGEVAAALLVGDRGGIPDDVTVALRVAGLGHVLAISGLHMALVAGTVFGVVRLSLALVPGLALARPIKKWAAVAGLLAATGYLLLSGASVATQRAYAMLAVSLVAVLLDRPAISLRNVALAAFVVMLVDPVAVTEPGFQMSFAAVIALVAAWEKGPFGLAAPAAPPGGQALPRIVLASVLTLAFTSIVAGFATGPVAAYHFHRVAPLGLLGNLAAMPIVTFLVMPAGVAGLAAMPVGLEGPPLRLMGLGLAWVIEIARWVESLTGTAGIVGRISAGGTLLAVAGFLWLSLWLAPWRLLGVPVLVAGLVLMPFGPRPDLLLADDGRTLAVRGADGRLQVLKDGGGGFAAAMWLKADGDPRGEDDPGLAGAARCDAFGCVLPLHGKDGAGPPLLVAFAQRPSALLADCRRAHVVVTRERVERCDGPLAVLDRVRLARTGSIAGTVERGPDGAPVLGLERSLPARLRPWHGPPDVRR